MTQHDKVKLIRCSHVRNGGSLSTGELSRITGFSPRYVDKILRNEKHYDECYRPPLLKWRHNVAMIVEALPLLISQGASINEVSRLFNVSENTIRKYLRLAGASRE